MKTKSLTQWSNLYSSELKYNISVKPSLIELKIKLGFNLIAVFFVIFFLYQSVTVEIMFIIPAFLITLFTLLFINQFNSFDFSFKNLTFNLQRNIQKKTNDFVLYETGDVEFNLNEKFTLDSNSRVGWFGCWLKLAPQNEFNAHSKKKHTFFIMKDSVSIEDYSKLTRVLIKHSS